MAIPLLMTGPGGDFVNRYDVKGHSLVRTVGQALGQQPDTETAGSFAGYSRQHGRRQDPQGNADNPAQPVKADVFEHQAPMGIRLYRPQTAATGRGVVRVSVAAPPVAESVKPAADPSFQNLAASLEAWLAAQQRSLIELARLLPRLARAVAESRLEEIEVEVEEDVYTPEPAYAAMESEHAESDTQATSHPYPDPRPAAGARLFAEFAGTGGRAGREQGDHLRAHRGPDQKRRPATRSAQGSLFGA